MSKAKITGIGVHVPQRILTNSDLEKMVETSDDWIVRRTGMRERRLAEKDEFASDLAIRAVQNLINKYQAEIDDVDMIIVTTFTPDHLIPTVSSLLQGHFGIRSAGSMDLNAACTGFVYGLCVADSLITAGHSGKVLVVAAETVSKVVDYSDRNTCILFGDAAAAVLVEKTSGEGVFLGSHFTSEGKLADYVTCSHLSRTVNEKKLGKERLFEQEGRFLYEYVVKNIPEGVHCLLKKTGYSLKDIQWFIPHSANTRMIKSLCERMEFPMERALVSNEFYGNTSSATIPLALWMAVEEGKIKSGDKILLYGFGGGLTHGGVLLEWKE